MATFILTAKSSFTRYNGYIEKGDQISISIHKFGVTPGNLFTRQENLPILRREFERMGFSFKNDNEVKYLWSNFDIKNKV